MPWLLDTNVLSEIRKPKPEPRVVAFIARATLRDLYISVVTLAELRFGIDLLIHDSGQRTDLTSWLTETIRPMFDGRVLPVSENVILRWRTLMEEGRKAGHTSSQPDILIAATALEYGHTAVTRDRRDFDKARVPVLNPWEL